jgi:hypothetical protein
MKHETAGDPMTGLKWTNRTTAKIAAKLQSFGIRVSARKVAGLLKKMGFSLRVNHKKLAGSSHPDRDAQFARIAELRERCAAKLQPVISIDTKKKELVGVFKNAGVKWDRDPVLVNDHDFRSDADGIAVPYGVYDLQANRGTLFVGSSYDTPAFAVDCVEKWWRTEGLHRYTGADRLAILADGGGSNGSRCRAWKMGLQHRLCDRHGLSVTVAHLPARGLKVEPNRASLLQRTQQELGRPTTRQPRDDAQVRPDDEDKHRSTRSRPSRSEVLREGSQNHSGRDAAVGHHERRRVARVELHDQSILRTGSYSCAGPKPGRRLQRDLHHQRSGDAGRALKRG